MKGVANAWGNFERTHPKAAKWVWQIGIFYLFSLAVTVLQYVLFTVLPYMFGIGLAGVEFMWPRIPISFGGLTIRGTSSATRWSVTRPVTW